MLDKNRILIVIGSPLDYEELVAYINIDSQEVAVLSQDDGVNNLKLEFYEDILSKKFDYNTFTYALLSAKKELLSE